MTTQTNGRAWLRQIAVKVVKNRASDRGAQSVRTYRTNRLKATESNAQGWCYVIGGIRGVRAGSFQVWHDRWAGTGAPILSFCYRGVSADVVRPVVSIAAQHIGNAIKRRGTVNTDAPGLTQMPRKLKRAEFGKPIFEEYSNHDCYYGIFLRDSTDCQDANALAGQVAQFFSRVAAAVTGKRSIPDMDDIPYPGTERRLVKSHLRWERSRRLAEGAKIRDGYQCRICSINFEHRYGRDFARLSEAHHIRPLSYFKRRRRTNIEDLITVRPNCHSMLHRMQGLENDVEDLKRIVSKAAAAKR